MLTLLILATAGAGLCASADPALQSLQESINQAVAAVRPSVVSVQAHKKDARAGAGALWYESIGSGLVVDPRGFILTNYHVVKNADYIHINLWRSKDSKFTAKIVDADETLDLALLMIDGLQEILAVPQIGNSKNLETGDMVICVGNPFGFKHSVTMGIVSDLHRQMVIEGVTYNNMIQTDAVINQGNSGGPLIDILGRVIGVSTAIYAPGGAYTGLGFAIPIARAMHFYTRSTGAKLVAAAAPAGEPINLTKPMPRDAVHKEFSDCTTCHTISQKSVVSTKAKMTHPPVGACDTCHILTNDKVAAGPTPVAAVSPLAWKDMPFGEFFTSVVLKMIPGILLASIVFAMLGLGGDFLYVPILLSCGISFNTAVTTSLVMLTFAQTTPINTFVKKGLVDLKLAMVLETPAMIGAFAGGLLSNSYNPAFMQVFFACATFLASYYMLQGEALLAGKGGRLVQSPWQWTGEFKGNTYTIDLMLAVPLMLVIGYMEGVLGIAGGWLKVPAMVLLFNVPMKIAVATSALMVAVSGFTGFLGHNLAGNFDARLALTLSAVALIGAEIGARISLKTESTVLRFLFAFVMSIVGVGLLIRLM
ncbi:MAG: TSUP family transporter [Pseudomonadota bacterium]